ncbi:hypothetical protein KUCAC02_024730, partial [Chaenocephalus aceratus]
MRDEVFKSNLVCAFIVLIFITTIQGLLPSARLVTMVVQFSILIVLHSCLVLVTTAEDYKCLPLVLRKACCWINETYAARNVIIFISILINFLAAMINILWCDFDKSGSGFGNQTFNESTSIPDICFYPEYFVFTGVLAMVTCAVFLRLNSVLKLAVSAGDDRRLLPADRSLLHLAVSSATTPSTRTQNPRVELGGEWIPIRAP